MQHSQIVFLCGSEGIKARASHDFSIEKENDRGSHPIVFTTMAKITKSIEESSQVCRFRRLVFPNASKTARNSPSSRTISQTKGYFRQKFFPGIGQNKPAKPANLQHRKGECMASSPRCLCCQQPIERIPGHRPRQYCGDICRKRASRARGTAKQQASLHHLWSVFPKAASELLETLQQRYGDEAAYLATDVVMACCSPPQQAFRVALALRFLKPQP